MTEQTYQRLYDIAQQLLSQGYPVIIDAAFLEQARRQHFQQLAHDIDCPYLILHCEAAQDELAERIEQRQNQRIDPSEATLTVLKQQIRLQQPLRKDEPFIVFSPEHRSALPAFVADSLNLTT